MFGLGDDTLPIDAWMYDSPFYEDFGAINRVEIQSPAGDAWMYDSPFYEEFRAINKVEVQGTASLLAMLTLPF